jgi:hypothetical protein
MRQLLAFVAACHPPESNALDAKGNEPQIQYYMFWGVWLYHRTRTHLALSKDAPEPRAKQPPDLGAVIQIAEVGGLHHRYERRAA